MAANQFRFHPENPEECINLFSAILDRASEAFICIDESQRILLFTQGAAHIFGYAPAEVIGKPLNLLLPSEMHARHTGYLEEFIQAAVTERSTTFSRPLQARRKDGTAFPAEANLLKMPVDGQVFVTIILRDLSETRQMEERLQEKERLLNESQRIAGIGIWEMDLETEQLTFSDAMYPLMGILPETFDHTHQGFMKLIHPDDQAHMEVLLAGLLAGEPQGEARFRIMLPGGGVRYILGKQKAYFGLYGKPMRLVGTAQDITAQQQAEEARRDSEERYRMLFEFNPIPMWVYELDTLRFLAVNDAAVRHYGYSREDFLSMTIADIRPREDIPSLMQNVAAVTDGLDEAGIWRHVKKDGSLIEVEITSHTLDFDDRKAELVLAHDVTERRKIENELRQSEQRFQLAVSAARIGTWEVNLQTRAVYWSEEYGKSHGLVPGQFPANEAEYFKVVHPEDQNLIARRFGAAIEKGGLYECEFRVLWPDGSVHWHSAVGRPVRDEFGNPARMIGIGMDITERKRVEERVTTQLRRMESLHAIDLAIASSLEVRLTLKVVIDAVISQLGVDAADILLFKTTSNALEFAAGQGFRIKDTSKRSLRLGKGFAGRIALEQRPIHIPDLAGVGEEFNQAALFAGEDFIAYFGVPLVTKGQIKGVLEVFHRTPLNPDEDWLNFLDTLAGQAAIAIDNALLFEGYQRSNMNLLLAYDATIEGWSKAMDLRDKETEGHTQRITEMTVQLALSIGMSDEDIHAIRWGALLHDMGKLGVPDAILQKPGPLTDEEWIIMRQHPQFAYDMLAPIEYLRSALDIPYCHHERWDGSGYPRGLRGELIPTPARLFAVVDVWDALRSDRPYRKAWPEERVLDYLRERAGKDFDPRAVELFLALLAHHNLDNPPAAY